MPYSELTAMPYRLLLCLFFLMASSALLTAQPLSPSALAVKEAVDARNAARLLALSGKSDVIDEQILLGSMSMQAEAMLGFIKEKLSAPVVAVRVAAARALGQTLRNVPARAKEFESSLFIVIDAEKNPEAKVPFIIALGECGSGESLVKLAALNFSEPKQMAAQAEAIARYANRGVKHPDAARKAASLITSVSSPTGINWAIYALARLADAPLLAPYQNDLCAKLHSPNPDEAMYAALALGRIRTVPILDSLCLALAESKNAFSDARVRVNAIRALPGFSLTDSTQSGKVVTALCLELRSQNYHVRKASLDGLSRLVNLPPNLNSAAVDSVGVLFSDISPDISTTAFTTFATLAPSRAAAIITNSLNPLIDTKSNATRRTTTEKFSFPFSPASLEAIGIIAKREKKVRPELLALLETHLKNPLPVFAAKAAGAYAECWLVSLAQSNAVKPIQFHQTLLAALEFYGTTTPQNELATQTVLGALSDSAVVKAAYLSPVMTSLYRFKSSENSETVLAHLDALSAIGGKLAAEPELKKKLAAVFRFYAADENNAVRKKSVDALEKLTGEKIVFQPPSPEKPDWAWLRGYAKNPVVILETSRGTIELELFLNDAPYTVKSFLDLTRKKFYDGLLFHRVVSNFVIQGGDPKGDGTGGPPYTIRSEFTPHTFERGTLGMASAGKDTEGSQFFIMHAHHPHLDGRYTLFGKVISGMDVVDKIEQRDKVIAARVKE
jgi:cyclophilin family peptidyl-prolyl cis-trans isomerase/HEAT repeat protein